MKAMLDKAFKVKGDIITLEKEGGVSLDEQALNAAKDTKIIAAAYNMAKNVLAVTAPDVVTFRDNKTARAAVVALVTSDGAETFNPDSDENKTREVAAKPKAKAPVKPKEPKVKRETSGGYIRELLLEQKHTDDEILAKNKEKFPATNPLIRDVRWHRTHLRKEGELPPVVRKTA